MLSIKFLEAYNGDCILISFSDNDDIVKNILIDGGTGQTYANRQRRFGNLKREVLNLIDNRQSIDLLIITHIDDDHIGGVLKLFEDKNLDKSLIKRVWFNSGKNIAKYFKAGGEFKERDIELKIYNKSDTSVKQGVKLDKFLTDLGCWDNRIIKRGLIENFSNSRITVLSPDDNGLKNLHQKWERESPDLETSSKETDYHISMKELIEGEDIFVEDKSIPNGSSIAILFEIEEKRILFLGDAYPNVVAESLRTIMNCSINKKLEIDLFKISHHASKGNTNSELLELIKCDNYVTSTNSLRHGLPDKITYARIIKANPYSKFLFNYNIIKKVFPEGLDYGKFQVKYLNNSVVTFD